MLRKFRREAAGQSGLLLPSGPAAPPPLEEDPLPLDWPGSTLLPGLVSCSVPLEELLPLLPPCWVLSGTVFGCGPDGGVEHEPPDTEQSLPLGAGAFESCA